MLQDNDFYLSKFACDKTLPNGTRLLYLEDQDVIPRTVHRGSMADFAWDSSLDYMHLVILKTPDGRQFSGLARQDHDGNYIPLYGMIGNDIVFFNYNADFSMMAPPASVTGSWYLDGIHQYLGETPDSRWEKANPGKSNTYTATGKFYGPTQENFVMNLSDINNILHASGAKTYAETDAFGECPSSQRQVGSFNDKVGAGRGNKKGAIMCGGYVITYEAVLRYPTTMSYNPSDGLLSLKFGNGTVTKNKVGWWWDPQTLRDNPSMRAQFSSDLATNPDAAYARRELTKWASQSPRQLWGDVSLTVIAKTDTYLVVKGKMKGTDIVFYNVWPDKNFEGRVFDHNTRMLLVKQFLSRKKMLADTREQRRKAQERMQNKVRANQESSETDLCKFDLFMNALRESYKISHIEYNKYKAPSEPYREPDPAYVLLTAKSVMEYYGMPASDVNRFMLTKGLDNNNASAMVNLARKLDDVSYLETDWNNNLLKLIVLTDKKIKILEIPFSQDMGQACFHHPESFSNARLTDETTLESNIGHINEMLSKMPKAERSAFEKEHKNELKTIKSKIKSVNAYSKAVKASETLLEAL